MDPATQVKWRASPVKGEQACELGPCLTSKAPPLASMLDRQQQQRQRQGGMRVRAYPRYQHGILQGGACACWLEGSMLPTPASAANRPLHQLPPSLASDTLGVFYSEACMDTGLLRSKR